MTDGSSRFIVITSIFEPSEAVRRFGELAGWRLVVVGDRKSPPTWSWPGVEYLSPEQQPGLGYRLSEALPWNHYARKMLGYLWALERGATVIVDTDDDNLPKSDWSFPPFDGNFAEAAGPRFYNAYRRFTDAFIWPRGYPLRLLKDDSQPALTVGPQQVGVWQGLADGDPDVDAIYRLVVGEPLTFSNEEPVVLGPGTVCPFNSQNTSFRPEVFALMYLPAFVTFRFTDILRSLVAQPILWAAGYRVGFVSATVTQERNAHDLLEDFGSEVPMYLQTERVVDLASSVVSANRSVEENLRVVYGALAEEGIVENAELDLLDVWLGDLAAIGVR
ncbi:MAG: hypothetical protein QOH16_1553 [Gaiellaceae bacterium]|nr:hypothetical protein [Gaiellaceae bacterium]